MKGVFAILAFAVIFSSCVVSHAHENYSAVSFSAENAIQLAYEHPGNRRRSQAMWAVVVNCREWITLRNEPSVYGDDLAHIPLGAQVMIYDAPPQNGFYPAKYNGILGWVLKDYVRITGAA